MGEGGKAGKTKKGQTNKADFAACIRTDAYGNHNNWNNHKQSLCHGSKPKVALAMPLNPPNSFCLRQLFVNPKQARYQNVFRLALWLLFCATLAAVTCARIRLLVLPLERDAGDYSSTVHSF